MSAAAVAADGALTAALSAAVAACGLPVVTLASGAGHDAVALAELTGVAMLFVRCAGGDQPPPRRVRRGGRRRRGARRARRFVRGLAR
jgi:allantoate deiminase